MLERTYIQVEEMCKLLKVCAVIPLSILSKELMLHCRDLLSKLNNFQPDFVKVVEFQHTAVEALLVWVIYNAQLLQLKLAWFL